ncbi:MAG: hypothetical protein RJA10_23 [Pseudomonadota bacterium]|jgi:hypothetical protein
MALAAAVVPACLLALMRDPASLPGPGLDRTHLGLDALPVLRGIACFMLGLAQVACRP